MISKHHIATRLLGGVIWHRSKVQIWKQKIWCRGYFVDTVGKNAKMIENYIRKLLKEDHAGDQISIKEFTDPFAGERVK